MHWRSRIISSSSGGCRSRSVIPAFPPAKRLLCLTVNRTSSEWSYLYFGVFLLRPTVRLVAASLPAVRVSESIDRSANELLYSHGLCQKGGSSFQTSTSGIVVLGSTGSVSDSPPPTNFSPSKMQTRPSTTAACSLDGGRKRGSRSGGFLRDLHEQLQSWLTMSASNNFSFARQLLNRRGGLTLDPWLVRSSSNSGPHASTLRHSNFLVATRHASLSPQFALPPPSQPSVSHGDALITGAPIIRGDRFSIGRCHQLSGAVYRNALLIDCGIV